MAVRGRKIKTACRGRTKKSCKSAKRTCKYAVGPMRKYCRKTKNMRRSKMMGGDGQFGNGELLTKIEDAYHSTHPAASAPASTPAPTPTPVTTA